MRFFKGFTRYERTQIYNIEQGSSSEANIHSAGQEIPCLL